MDSIKQATQKPSLCAVQVIGCGIAGLGIAFAADRKNYLDKLCQQGLVYLDKRSHNQFDSLSFDISSNSPANDFLAGIDPDGVFAMLLNSRYGCKLRQFANKEVPLTDVSGFFNEASQQVQRLLKPHAQSGFIFDTVVAALRIEPTGEITSLDNEGRVLQTSQIAVIASGGIEKKDEEIQQMANDLGGRLECSESILRRHCDSELTECLEAGKDIIIIGGSHSAFSVVDYIVRRFRCRLRKHQVKVITRSAVQLHYANLKEFNYFSQAGEKCLVDFETQSINRYCGLRADAKKIYQSIVKGEEDRVEVVFLESFQSSNRSEQTGIIIQATGYRTVFPKIIDSTGCEVNCSHAQGVLGLSTDYTVQSYPTNVTGQIFGIGLGSFVAPSTGYTKRTEVPVGVNVYHQKDAAVIVERIIQYLSGTQLNTQSTQKNVTYLGKNPLSSPY